MSHISGVVFEPSNDEINRLNSYATISTHELYSSDGTPVNTGVHDIRMGTIDYNQKCGTCNKPKKKCLGHQGVVELNHYILNPILVQLVKKWLKIVCPSCGCVINMKKKFSNTTPVKRLSELSSADTSGKQCPNCSNIQPKYIKDTEDKFTFWIETKNKKSDSKGEKLYPDNIRNIFEKVNPDVVTIIGFKLNCHPKNLLLKTIVVPPNTIRPGIKNFTSKDGSYHEITSLIQHIVKRNISFPSNLSDMIMNKTINPDLDKSLQNMQQLCFDLITGNASNPAQGNSGKRSIMIGTRPYKGIIMSLPRKEGDIRRTILGKRVFNISRTTISGDISKKIDEVGIPLEFARIMQIQEIVQEYNKEWLNGFFLNGTAKYPGSTRIILKSTGEVYDVSKLTNYTISNGDILFRDIIDGDFVYFNRAPTLEATSIGVHRAIVNKDPNINTFQINVLTTPGYGADFDGDQMNLWIPRNASTRAEAQIMSSIHNVFISPNRSGTVNGQVQDSILGCYELTVPGKLNNFNKFNAMMMFKNIKTDIQFDKETYTGKELLSMLMDKYPINISGQPSSFNDVYSPYINYDPDEIYTVIKKGKLLSGVLDKKLIGVKSLGIYYIISRDYGQHIAMEMIFAFQQLALEFLRYKGVTIDATMLLPKKNSLDEIDKLISATKLEGELNADKLISGDIVPPVDSNIVDYFEQMQINTLKVPESELLRYVLGDIDNRTNGLFKMVATGSKGSNPNLIHISGTIGQTTVNGYRIGNQFAFKRTSPYHHQMSTDIKHYGFVSNSYIRGMSLVEFLAQSYHGRNDLITKALTTAISGDAARKLYHNLQCVVDNTFAVVKGTRIIVQFIYSGDGIDTRKIEKVNFHLASLSNKKLDEIAKHISNDTKEQSLINVFMKRLIDDRTLIRNMINKLCNSKFGYIPKYEFMIPVNIKRLVELVELEDDIVPGLYDRLQRVLDFSDNISYVFLNEIQENNKMKVPEYLIAASSVMSKFIRYELNPKVLSKLTNEKLSFIFDNIRVKYDQSLIDYGTAVGIWSSQSISEPLTQYFLDSHHRSVAGSTGDAGISRLSEICGMKDISDNESMIISVDEKEESEIKKISLQFEYNELKKMVKEDCMLLESYSELIHPDYIGDAEWIAYYETSHPLIKTPNDLTNWCLRIVLDKSKLLLNSIDLQLIVKSLRSNNQNIHIVHTSEAIPIIVIRIWFRSQYFKKNVYDDSKISEIVSDILNTPIRGIKGIHGSFIEKVCIMNESEDGSFVKEDILSIKTHGTNLYQTFLHPLVDKSKLISTSVQDTYKMCGIEAARERFVYEMESFMSSNYPNEAHIKLLADELTRIGILTAFERGDIKKREKNNPLLSIAAGAPVQIITDAVMNNSESKVYGLSPPEILGGIAQVGSIYNRLFLDEDFIKSNKKTLNSVLDEL